MAFDITSLREIGAIPVIYVPQGTTDNPHSLIPTFAVNGVYHTKYVLSKLQELKVLSDAVQLSAKTGMPVSPACEAILTNPDPDTRRNTEHRVQIAEIEKILRYLGFRNIPFDHSVAVPDYFLNLCYPTDNAHRTTNWGIIANESGG